MRFVYEIVNIFILFCLFNFISFLTRIFLHHAQSDRMSEWMNEWKNGKE